MLAMPVRKTCHSIRKISSAIPIIILRQNNNESLQYIFVVNSSIGRVLEEEAVHNPVNFQTKIKLRYTKFLLRESTVALF